MKPGCGWRVLLLALVFLSVAPSVGAERGLVRVGAKNFTEQQILAELVAQSIERYTDLRVERRFGLGGTGVCHAALLAGELDVYVEYTGTALQDVLQVDRPLDSQTAYRYVARRYREDFDVVWLPPLGFNNTYILAVRPADAQQHDWKSISDLRPAASRLRAGFTSEFVERPDGYPGLRRVYQLDFAAVRDLDPGLMYEALAADQVDVISAFATDGRLAAFGFVALADDRAFFPPYDAAPIVRGEVLRAHPEIGEALCGLVRTLDEAGMQRLNARTDLDKQPPSAVAADWLGVSDPERGAPPGEDVASPGLIGVLQQRRAEIGRKLFEHLGLSAAAMLLAAGVGVPLGLLLARRPVLAQPVIALTEVVQTIPSLAMLAFLFSLFGVLGARPAIAALVLYALLPIVVGAYTGVRQVAPELRTAADGLGMTGWQRLRLVELPLAAPVIVAAIRTATVWTVGIATLSTYIGAGGLGDFISRGLARNDATLTLLGAIPAALLAVVLSHGIRLVERGLTPARRR